MLSKLGLSLIMMSWNFCGRHKCHTFIWDLTRDTTLSNLCVMSQIYKHFMTLCFIEFQMTATISWHFSVAVNMEDNFLWITDDVTHFMVLLSVTWHDLTLLSETTFHRHGILCDTWHRTHHNGHFRDCDTGYSILDFSVTHWPRMHHIVPFHDT